MEFTASASLHLMWVTVGMITFFKTRQTFSIRVCANIDVISLFVLSYSVIIQWTINGFNPGLLCCGSSLSTIKLPNYQITVTDAERVEVRNAKTSRVNSFSKCCYILAIIIDIILSFSKKLRAWAVWLLMFWVLMTSGSTWILGLLNQQTVINSS